MMRKFLYKILIFIFFLSIGPAYLAYYNIKHDPYGVVLGNMEYQFTEPNQRLLKVKHLVNNPKKYDSYIMGSSRAGKMTPDSIAANGKWYNLAYSEGVPSEHLEDLKTMLLNGVQIKHLVIAVDNISYYVDSKIHDKHVLRKRYVNPYNPYFDFVFLKPDKKLMKTIKKIEGSPNNPVYDIYESGVSKSPIRDLWATKDSAKHVLKKRFNDPAWAFYYKPRVDKTLEEIDTLIQFCNKNDITIDLVMNPMHHSTFLKQDLEVYYTFLKGLAQRTSYWDFSGINKITTNNFWYYETSHFRTVIGDRMLDVVLEGKEDVFGQRITSDNVDQVIIKNKQEILDYKNKLMEAKKQDSTAIN